MHARNAIIILGLVVSAGLSACTRHEPPPSQAPTVTATAGPAIGGGPAEAAKAVLMDSVVLGHALAADGSVAAPGTSFAQGNPLFVSLTVSAISPGTEVKLSWYAPAGTGEGDDQLVVPPGASVVNFRTKDTSAWPAGLHRVEIWVGGAKAGEKTFTVTAPQATASVASPR
jgi:hypothetical protein